MLFELLFIFLFTLLLVSLLVPVGGYRTYRDRFSGRRVSISDEPSDVDTGAGVGMAMLFLFFILFPLILAGNVWIGPRGPMFMGVSWLPIVAIGIILTLLFAAILPRPPKVDPAKTRDEVAEETVVGLFGGFFFLLLFVALAAIVIGYNW